MAQDLNILEEAVRAGFDLSLIDENLGYSHEHRAVNHQAALATVLEFERAGRELRDRNQSARSATE